MNSLSSSAKAILEKNPFIHGTSSSALAFMPDHKLQSLAAMLEQGLAPPCGEIVGGGMDGLLTDCRTSFGRVVGTSYPLQRVSSCYATPQTQQTDLKEITACFMRAWENSHVTQMLLFATRARQVGLSILEGVEPEKRKELQSRLEETCGRIVTSYPLAPFVAKFVQGQCKRDLEYFIEDLQNFLVTHSIDLLPYLHKNELALEDSTIAKLGAFLAANGFQLMPKATTLSVEQDNTFNNDYFLATAHFRAAFGFLHTAFTSPKRIFAVMRSIENELPPFIQKVNCYFERVKATLFSQEYKPFQPLCEDRSLVEEPFGIILMSDATHQPLFEQRGGEFRATQPLQLGREISLIATQAENIERVQAYLDRYHIRGIEVISIQACYNP